MARGWESKSVEAQIDVAKNQQQPSADPKNSPDPAKLQLIRKRETILLSRTRVVRELASATNPRYKDLMTKALRDLDAQLKTFAAD